MPNDGLRVENVRLCRLCGCEGKVLYDAVRDRLFGVAGTWALWRCPACGLVWLNPCPLPEEIGKLYTDYFTHQAVYGVQTDGGALRGVRDVILADRFGYALPAPNLRDRILGAVLSWIGPAREVVEMGVMTLHGRAGGTLLDVGCGNGGFLVRMRSLGWDVTGVEPDPNAAAVARQRFGLTVLAGTLADAGFPSSSFDAVTLSHVIEHVPDPVVTLRECRRLIRRGGMVVVVTPNVESLGHRLFGPAWRGLETPRHLHLFSVKTLRDCAEQAGLRVAGIRTAARTARWMWAASRAIQQDGILPGGLPGPQRAWGRLEGLVFYAVEYAVSRVAAVGEELVLTAMEPA